MNKLTAFLVDEQQAHHKGGLNHKAQVQLAYNSNRECLRHGIVPFVIDNEHKLFYYRGLSEFSETPGLLIGTMQSAQDTYTAWVKYFNEELMDLRESGLSAQ